LPFRPTPEIMEKAKEKAIINTRNITARRIATTINTMFAGKKRW
jgi:hypothetical protein